MKYDSTKSCSNISNVIAWLESQKEEYGDIDVRLTGEWMTINEFGYVDPTDEENPQWLKDKIGNIEKPFAWLGPSNAEFSEDRSKVIRYNRNLSPYATEEFINTIEGKLDMLANEEITIDDIKIYLEKIKERFICPRTKC